MKKSVRIFWRIFLIGFASVVLIVLLANFGVFGKMPSLAELENPTIHQASEVIATDGTLMGKYYTEKGNRSNVKYRDISPNVINALIATEDERFYDHSGIDFRSTLRAAFTLGKQGGGSTITQQLALNLFNERASNPIKRVIQKLKEWIIAVKLERNFTKEEIITLYLNAVPFGDNVYGIRNASRTFFQTEPDRLKVEEAAVLIGMLKANYTYNPRRNPKAAMERRNVVLNQMVVNGKLAADQAEKLKKLPIDISRYRKMDESNGYAPYFREILRDNVKKLLKDIDKPGGGQYDIYKDGLKIYTTIDPRMQEYAEEAVAAQMPKMQKALEAQSNVKNGSIWKGYENVLEKAMKSSDRWKAMAEDGMSDKEIKASFNQKVNMKVFAWNSKREKDTIMTPYDSIKYHRQMLQAAFMVMDPITGEVRAWVGGVNFKTYKFDHANLNTKRQVGSTIKPLLYMEAIEEAGYTPETEVIDQQQNFGRNQLVPATSKTCTGRTMTMASALAYSRNCATAYIMKEVGADRFANFLSQLSIPTKVEPYPSIALGSCDLSLYEMMWAYSVFPGRGFTSQPNYITRIEDRNGNVIKRFDYSTTRKEAVSEVTAYTMARMMQGTVDQGTAAGLRGRLGAAEMGGKTGTTNSNADFWFMGFTPQLLGGTWVGCDDRFIAFNSPAFYGGSVARPIWEAFFKKVYADKKLGIEKDAKFSQPADYGAEINSADWIPAETEILPAGEGEDQGVGTADDYSMTHEFIGAESQKVIEDDAPKKDTAKKTDNKDKPIGAPKEDPKKKKNLIQKIFGKKDKEKDKKKN